MQNSDSNAPKRRPQFGNIDGFLSTPKLRPKPPIIKPRTVERPLDIADNATKEAPKPPKSGYGANKY